MVIHDLDIEGRKQWMIRQFHDADFAVRIPA